MGGKIFALPFDIDILKDLRSNQDHCVKTVQIRSFSGPYFPAFGLNTEIHSVNLRTQSECGKIRTRKNSVFGHFSRSGFVRFVLNQHFLCKGTVFSNFIIISRSYLRKFCCLVFIICLPAIARFLKTICAIFIELSL